MMMMTPSLLSGDHAFAVVPYYSRYVEIQVRKSTTTDKVIAGLKQIFLTHGLPISIVTDNGPNLSVTNLDNSWKMRKFSISQYTTVATGEQRNGASEPFLAKAHQNYSDREERLERGTRSLIDNVQDHIPQHYRCKPRRAKVW